MKKLLMIATALAALSLLAPSSSYAGIPDKSYTDYMGLYITSVDGVAVDYLSCTNIAFAKKLKFKIILLNPSIASTGGFECGWDITGPGLTTFSTNCTITYPTPGIDVGQNSQPDGTWNIIVGFGAPMVTTSETQLAEVEVFYLDFVPLDVTLRAAIPPSILSGTPAFMSADYLTLYPAPVTQDVGSATIHFGDTNCEVTLPTEEMSWGSMKSLFR